MPPGSRRTRRAAVLVAAVSVLAVAAFWHLALRPSARAAAVPLGGLTVSGTGAQVERVSTGGRRVAFGPEGVLLGIPLGQEIRNRRLRLALSDVEGLAWAGVSLWPTGAPHSNPVFLGRAFAAGSPPDTLEFALADGDYRAAHVELRPHGGAARLTLQAVELRPPALTPPPPAVLVSVGLLVGGAVSFVWLTVSVWLSLPSASRRRLVVAALVFGIGSTALLFTALALEGTGQGHDAGVVRAALEGTAGFPSRVVGDLRSELHRAGLQSRKREGGLRHIGVHLSPQALATLEAKREAALAGGGVLIAEAGDEVDGYLTLDGGDPVRIRTRLKGDWVDHLEGRAFSLRVRVRGQPAILGMRRFSIQRPQTRVGHYEAMVLEQMRDDGLIVPRYEFVHFSLNDEALGVMAVEEFMSKELLEANGRREGVILALDEDFLWRQRRQNALLGSAAPGSTPVALFEAAHRSPLRTFQEGRVLQDPFLRQQYADALGLLRGYFEGRLAPEEIFDLERLGRFFAIVNLWNADHPTWWHNVRVYFNPVTRLFEPIGFDNNVPVTPPSPDAPPEWRGSDFYHLEGAERFREAYREAMARLRAQVRSGELEAWIRRWEADHFSRMGPQDYQDPPYPFGLMEARLDLLDRVEVPTREASAYDPGPAPALGPHPALVTFVHAFWVKDEAGAYLEFQNITDRPVTIDAVEYAHRRLSSRVPLDLGPLEVPAGDVPGQRLRVPVPYDPLDLDGGIHVVATLDEDHAGRTVTARRYFPAAGEVPFRPDQRERFLERFPFVGFDPGTGYRVRSGTWDVEADLRFPDDAPLLIEPGVTLRFASGTRLVVRRRVTAKGRPEEPIRLVARDNPWGGLVVLQASGRSELSHVAIEGIDYPGPDPWGLTGAVTFYESDVTMTDVRIRGTRTEDALNILRSGFHLERFEVDGAPSDALDVDFGRGRILQSRFLDLGGDAIDVSGTEVEVEALLVRGARDKALSVGEASTLRGRDIDISDVGTGIASKDGSSTEIRQGRLSNVAHAAFMAYVKKTEFGPARLVVRGVHLQSVGRIAVPVGDSTVEVDGKKAMRVELDVGQLYRTGYMAK